MPTYVVKAWNPPRYFSGPNAYIAAQMSAAAAGVPVAGVQRVLKQVASEQAAKAEGAVKG